MIRQRSSKGALVLVMMLTMTAPTAAQERADKLEDKAAKLYDQPARYSEAAWLYREAAALRPDFDPRGVEDLARAAHLYGYAERFLDARKLMEQAAERARARGDIARASRASLDAAFFADKQGKQVHVERLARTALELAESPLVNTDERDEIVQRIKASPVMVGLLGDRLKGAGARASDE